MMSRRFTARSATALGAVAASTLLAACSSGPALHEPAPAFSATDAEGQTVTLAAYEGKVVLMDFWATWCGPCRASTPNVQRIAEHYAGDARVEVLAVHFDDKGDPAAYVAEHGLDARLIPNGSEMARAWDVRALPTFVVVGADGTVVYRHTGQMGDRVRENIIGAIDAALR
ncbi:MAG: TlpA disulfide reductase family protein [Phycisphaerales bacterium]